MGRWIIILNGDPLLDPTNLRIRVYFYIFLLNFLELCLILMIVSYEIKIIRTYELRELLGKLLIFCVIIYKIIKYRIIFNSSFIFLKVNLIN